MPKKIFKYLKKILPFIGIILFFIYIYYFLDVNIIIETVLSISPIYFVLIAALTIPRVLVRNTAWQMILKEQKINISYYQSLKIFLIGYFYGSFTPGYMGQLMRIPYLKEKTNEPYGKLFVNSTIETIVHTFSLYVMMIIGALLVISLQPELFTLTVLWIIILIIILLFFIKKERGEKLFKILIKLVKYCRFKKLEINLIRFVNTFYKDFPKINKLILPTIVGSFTWIIIFSQEYILVYALNLDIPYLYFLLLFPIANIIGFIPITIAGIGSREITAIFLFTTLFAVSAEEILVVSLVGFFMTDLFTGFVGFLVSLTETKRSYYIPK